MILTARYFLPIKTALGCLEISARRSSETNGSIQNADGMYPQIKHDTSSSSDDARGILCSPYSHFWYLRSGARANSAARSCVMPQRARRSASWVAVSDKGPFGPARLGWLLMSLAYRVLNLEPFAGVEAPGSILGAMNVLGVNVAAIQAVGVSVIVGVEQLSSLDKKHESAEVGVGDVLECQVDGGHFVSSAPVIPRRGGQRFAVHVSNVAPKRRSVKRYLQRFETVTSWGAA